MGHTHRGHRSAESIEFRRALQFCFHFSKFDSKFQERVFVGEPNDLKIYVEATVEDAYLADIPDTPQGLVLADNRCRGAFQ